MGCESADEKSGDDGDSQQDPQRMSHYKRCIRVRRGLAVVVIAIEVHARLPDGSVRGWLESFRGRKMKRSVLIVPKVKMVTQARDSGTSKVVQM